MDGFNNIKAKLEKFQQKFYTRRLFEGALLFLAFGILAVLVILGIEYFLWLGSTGRLILLGALILSTGILTWRYLLHPVLQLLKISRGLSNREASKIIGQHFPQVGDRLLNLMDLSENREQTELLLASIEQRSTALNNIPFTKAVQFRNSLRYAKYLIIPGVIVLTLLITGTLKEYFSSYERVVNYASVYEPPAPFEFTVITGPLTVLETEEVEVLVYTEGDVQPENVYAVINGKPLLLSKKDSRYTHTFKPPLASTDFYFQAEGVQSRPYSLTALKTPVITDLSMELNYPAYTGRTPEVIRGTGDASFPEGTTVRWSVSSEDTDDITFNAPDTMLRFEGRAGEFSLSKRVYNSISYELMTSNTNVANFEKLGYRFKVLKDAYPAIQATHIRDSLNPNIHYFMGEASDDYLIRDIRLRVYPTAKPDAVQEIILENPGANFKEFYYTFPSGLDLAPGEAYALYFIATDNDGIRNGKSSKTQVFSLNLLDDNKLLEQRLDNQQSLIDGMEKSVEELKKQEKALEELSREQKEKKSLNFNDESQIQEFLKKQQQQEALMEKFSRELKEHIEENSDKDTEDELLKERLERREAEARKNEKLLEELRKIADKIDKEELQQRLEELGKQQKQNARSLEQLLELTKRYYVTEKAAQLARELEKLSEKQEILTKIDLGELFENKEQQKLNSAFENIDAELDELKKDNQDLKKPLNLDIDKEKAEEIKADQQEAVEEIMKEQGEEQSSEQQPETSRNRLTEKQKAAARKMKEMSEALQQAGSGAASQSSIAEDAEMLRQILDNLVIFSFKQEKLYNRLQRVDPDIANFSATVREQNELKALFEHVDDSLFALSLRQAEIAELVNEQITEVYYNTEKALESMAENRMYQGASYQQYILNAANTLADFLANLLDNMQQSLSQGKGSGSGENEFQLPTIIKSQGELQGKMQEMMKGSESGEKGAEGKEGQQGQQEGQGKDGGEGQDGKENGDKEGGNSGKDGQNGAEGKDGNQDSEAEMQELYEIYKEQQRIRQALEQQLEDMMQEKDKALAKKILEQIADFEEALIKSGVTQRTMDKMNTIQHQLMKLENAAMKQGQKEERESQTNDNQFANPITTKPEALQKIRQEIEILSRQALPLRPAYRDRVREYFKGND